ncbi:MAG: hypothetical protein QM473_05585 [Acidobacteriota bacterium]|jgi:hypothetical protein|nr:hypothetical protein [Acidobacteriota bacterium]
MVSTCAIIRNALDSPVGWSKDTPSGAVVDGLQEWALDPGGAGWLFGRNGHKPAVARRKELLGAWIAALLKVAGGEHASPPWAQEAAGEVKIRAENHGLQLELGLQTPHNLPLDRLEGWRRQCNQSLRLAAIAPDWSAVTVWAPYVEPDDAAADTVVQALYHARDQLQTIFASLADPVVCEIFLRRRGDAK